MPDSFAPRSNEDNARLADDVSAEPAAAESAGAGRAVSDNSVNDHALDTDRSAANEGVRRGPKHGGGKKNSSSGPWGWLRELVMIVAIALVLSFLIKTFLFRAFYIPSGSMENTLEINDRIFVNLLVPEPMSIERGDIVVFKDTKGWLPPAEEQPAGLQTWINEALTFIGLIPDSSQQHLVKRVIGLGGDHVVCCDAEGRVTVNGEPIEEPYLYPGAVPSEAEFDVVVPEGMLWVMGDHRNASSDSREHQRQSGDGFIDVEDVDGEAVVIAWPLNHITLLGGYNEVFEDVPEPSSAQNALEQQPGALERALP